MNQWLINLISTVQLTRLANAFAGVANLWFVVLWSRAHPEAEHMAERAERIENMQLWLLLALTAIIGIGMSAYAGAVNDLFDFRRDQAFSPDRPLPSGRIMPQAAAAIGFFSLIISIVCALVLGTLPAVLALMNALLILIFNAAARHIPGIGFITIAAIYGMHMLMVGYGLRFVWPVMLIMVHATVVHAVVYRLEEKRPKINALTIVGSIIGVFGLCIALIAQCGHAGPLWSEVYTWYGLSWPLAAVIVFTVTAVNKARFASSQPYAAEKLQRYGALWMGIYGLAWLLGGGLYTESAFLGALVLIGVLWMLFIRDLGAWIEQPIGYRW